MVLLALFIALSVVGGYIKIPNPITSSIAFDSLPAYLAALIFGGPFGAIVAFLGHMASAAIGGFPLSLPVHLIIGAEMALIMIAFNYVAKKVNITSAVVVGTVLNGAGAGVPLIFIPGLGMPAYLGSIVPLTVATIANILLCVLVYKPIQNSSVVKELRGINDGI
jgi:riboflavin transporter